MKWKKYNYIFYGLGIIGLLSFIVFYIMTPGFITPEESVVDNENISTSSDIQNHGLVEIYKHYKICNHTIKEQEFTLDINNDSLAELQKEYPLEEGWVLEKGARLVKLNQDLNALCPRDKEKRHLAAAGEYLAVFTGPVGSDHELERITDIKISSLPEEWQEKVFRGLLDFSNEAELLEALDSLDEYE